jgi:hypothetical protein
MRCGIWCILLLLGPPQAALADVASGAVPPVFPGVEQAIERAETPDPAAAPSLDLRIDPAPMSPAQPRPYGAPGQSSDRTSLGNDDDAADRGFSFGLEVKPRTRLGALARRNQPGDSGLDEQLENLIERPVFGLRGRYRF